jgi:hypothetical protein
MKNKQDSIKLDSKQKTRLAIYKMDLLHLQVINTQNGELALLILHWLGGFWLLWLCDRKPVFI